MIYGHVNGQSLYVHNDVLASETIDKITAKFEFGPEWGGMTKVVFFEHKKKPYPFLLEDDVITADKHLNLWAGHWNVYVWGFEFTEGRSDIEVLLKSSYPRLTTVVAQLTVENTGIAGTETIDQEMMGFGEQVLAAATQAKARVDELVRRANEGEFDGKSVTIVDRRPHVEKGNGPSGQYEIRPPWETLVFSDGTEVDVKSGKNGADGKDGQTPYVGPNGNWWLGWPVPTDTGKSAQGVPMYAADEDGLAKAAAGLQTNHASIIVDTDTTWSLNTSGSSNTVTIDGVHYLYPMSTPETDSLSTTVAFHGEAEDASGKIGYDLYIVVQDFKVSILKDKIKRFAVKRDAAVTEQTVADWGFTKNEGTYDKPVNGIPESDLSADVRIKLNDKGGKVPDDIILVDGTPSDSTHMLVDTDGEVIEVLTLEDLAGLYTKPMDGIPESDLSAEVQSKLNAGGGSEVTETTVREWGFAYQSEIPDTEPLEDNLDKLQNAVFSAPVYPVNGGTQYEMRTGYYSPTTGAINYNNKYARTLYLSNGIREGNTLMFTCSPNWLMRFTFLNYRTSSDMDVIENIPYKTVSGTTIVRVPSGANRLGVTFKRGNGDISTDVTSEEIGEISASFKIFEIPAPVTDQHIIDVITATYPAAEGVGF